MAPKSATESVSTVASESVNTSGGKEVKREEIFARFDKPFGWEPEVANTIWLVVGHACTAYILYLNFTGQAPWSLVIPELVFGYIGGLGITVGCHRYWTHKTFKANLRLQGLLMIMQTISAQYPIYKWSRDHRLHHKYTDTDADPHNSRRGFWFSHMTWLVLPKRKELKEKLKTFDMSDLEKDPIVRFQCKWYWTLSTIFHFIIPIAITYYFCRAPLIYCFSSNARRYVGSLHVAFFVNSLAHMWGDKPYDRWISSTENVVVSFLAIGEGWHNYHHTFPWDYKTSEFGWKMNASTIFIDFFAWIGWAYDLKTVSHKMLKDRIRRTGDGSHAAAEENNGNYLESTTLPDLRELVKSGEELVWGWEDESLSEDFRKATTILSRGGLN